MAKENSFPWVKETVKLQTIAGSAKVGNLCKMPLKELTGFDLRHTVFVLKSLGSEYDIILGTDILHKFNCWPDLKRSLDNTTWGEMF